MTKARVKHELEDMAENLSTDQEDPTNLEIALKLSAIFASGPSSDGSQARKSRIQMQIVSSILSGYAIFPVDDDTLATALLCGLAELDDLTSDLLSSIGLPDRMCRTYSVYYKATRLANSESSIEEAAELIRSDELAIVCLAAIAHASRVTVPQIDFDTINLCMKLYNKVMASLPKSP